MIEKAKIKDAREIQKIIQTYAKKGYMLPRSLSEIYSLIRDYFVFRTDEKIVGTCALHVVWEDLCELRSLAVLPEFKRKGIGKKLVLASIDEAKLLGVKRVFILTYNISFFERFGFFQVEKSLLPQKVWLDCIRCPKFPDCDETAMILEL